MNQQEYQDRTILLREELCNEYSEYVSPILLNQYRLPEKRLIVNDNDPDLYPIPLNLPSPPPYHTIDGFGKAAKDQYFRPPKIPMKLQDLLKSMGSKATINDIYEALERNKVFYKEEIRWMHLQWYYRMNGYWFFNNGIPTYIDGWHWFYLSYWKLNIGLPEYRYRDRIFFLFARYCYTTTEAPFFYRIPYGEQYKYFYSKEETEKFIQANGLLMNPEKGKFIVDMGRRTLFGFNYPKHRREGATYKAACILYQIGSMKNNSICAIQSKDEKSAREDVYDEKIILPFNEVPFFFKPQYKSSIASSLEFNIPNKMTSTGGSAMVESGLKSIIAYRAAGERQFDGKKIDGFLGDESGKPGDYNCILRHDVIMKALAQGTEIHGLEMNTSTVSDTSGYAGHNYMVLCKMSKWEKRNSNTGRTESGLASLFTSALYNFDGFNDRHGNPIIKTPTPEQAAFIKNSVGSEDWIKSELESKPNEISHYEYLREYPTKYRHCFLSAGKDSGFDLKTLSETIADLELNDNKAPRVGNFEWVSKFGGDVKFVDNPKGKFELSYIPATPNAFITNDGKKCPANTDTFVASADPFKFENTNNGKKSDGGGCVYLKHDPNIDPPEKETKDWITDRAVCAYRQRVDYKEEYKEDMLKMCIYFGCKIFPENNENAIYEHFSIHGFDQYLMYKITNGKRDANPGFYSDVKMKQKIFSLIMDKIHSRGRNERHISILREIMDIQGLEDMTNYDLFTAYGGCLLAIYFENEGKPKVDSLQEEDNMTKFLSGDY